ncbi:MAG: hypothetical protein AB7V16_11155 [Vulcanibacillus sp.]
MEQIISALVTGGAALIGVVLAEIFSGGKILKLLERHDEKTDETKDKLSKDYADLSKENVNLCGGLSTQHVLIMERVSNISSGVNNINNIVVEEKQNQNMRYDSLTDKQKEIKSQMQAIELLTRDWENQSLIIKTMQKDITELREENSELKEQLIKIKNKNRNKDLER